MGIFEHDGWPRSYTAWFELLSCIALAIALTTAATTLIGISWPVVSLKTASSAVASFFLALCSLISWWLVLAAVKGGKDWRTAWMQVLLASAVAVVMLFQVSIPVAQAASTFFDSANRQDAH